MPSKISSQGHYYLYDSFADFTTTVNVYTQVAAWSVGHFSTKRLRFSAATNNLNAKVLGSFDGGATYPIEVIAEFAVVPGTPVIQTITELYTDLSIQVDPAVDDTHGTLSVQYAGWSR